MKGTILVPAAMVLCLAGCATDSYSLSSNAPADVAPVGSRAMKDALLDCKMKAISKHNEHGNSSLVGAIIAGPVGAIIGSAADQHASSGDAYAIKPLVESCMASIGYSANPDNDP